MKKILVIFFLAVVIVSCKKEDSCTSEDFVGTWNGKEVCVGFDPIDVDIKIVKNGSKLDVSGGSNFTTITSEIDNCTFEGGQSVAGIGDKLSGSLKDNDSTLLLVYKFGVGLVSQTCTYVLTK